MIYGIGTDIVSIKRISTIYCKQAHRFVVRILSDAELSKFNAISNTNKKILYLAGRWAAKEAIVKALGTGFRNGLYLNQISIINNEFGQPQALFSETAKQQIKHLLSVRNVTDDFLIHLSLSHEVDYATSMVVVEIK
jgi:holo-[acyl-carrier protein] synthase